LKRNKAPTINVWLVKSISVDLQHFDFGIYSQGILPGGFFYSRLDLLLQHLIARQNALRSIPMIKYLCIAALEPVQWRPGAATGAKEGRLANLPIGQEMQSLSKHLALANAFYVR
jgi:hypothetical protein